MKRSQARVVQIFRRHDASGRIGKRSRRRRIADDRGPVVMIERSTRGRVDANVRHKPRKRDLFDSEAFQQIIKVRLFERAWIILDDDRLAGLTTSAMAPIGAFTS